MRRMTPVVTVLAMIFAVGVHADTVAVLEFHFDNDGGVGEDYTDGGTVHDYSGNGTTGHLSSTPGVPEWTADGIAGGAFNFTGTGDTGQSVLVNHDDSLNPGSGDFALALWILTRDNVDGDVLRKGSSGNSSTWYKIEHSPSTANNKLSLNFNTTGNDATVHSQNAYADEQWHFVVAQRNGDIAELWIDGILDGTDAISGSISNTGDLAIGSKDTLDDDFLNGMVDELTIYMGALSEQQIQEMYSTIPEPATLTLLGLGCMAFLRKRKS